MSTVKQLLRILTLSQIATASTAGFWDGKTDLDDSKAEERHPPSTENSVEYGVDIVSATLNRHFPFYP
jgi:hypothetical protein